MTVILNAHSYFSLLESPISPKALGAVAAARGYKTVALTDHNLLSGTIEFMLACQEHGIKPVLGLEVDLQIEPLSAVVCRIPLLVESELGWKNLCKLSATLLLTGQPLSLSQLTQYAGGLICLTGGRQGLLSSVLTTSGLVVAKEKLADLASIFPGNLCVQIDRSGGRKDPHEIHIQQLAADLNLPLVAAPAIDTLEPDQNELLPVMQAIRNNQPVSRADNPFSETPAGNLPTTERFQSEYEDIKFAMKNALELAERCTYQIPLGTSRLPKLHLPHGRSPLEVLKENAYAGAKQIYGAISPTLAQRLDRELEVIAQRGYEPIFLIMQEALEFARREGILFSSRGSAASSLVAHCLGITHPDPLRLGLYFERFLNPDRATPPDIDTDIDSRRRDELIQHMFDVYGSERVAMVATINRFRPRSAVSDVAKALSLTQQEVSRLSQELPHSFFAVREGSGSQEYLKSIFQSIQDKYPQEKYRQVFRFAQALLGNPRHLSVHAGGLVIAPGVMTDIVPVMRSGAKGVIITQFDLDSLEHLGLVKMDLLGIRGLTVLADVAAAIFSWRQKEYARPLDVLDQVPDQDERTGKLVCEAKTIGCFQIESPGMRATLRQLGARTPDEIMAALALYRPGPLRGGLHDAFIRRHRHEEPVQHIHPALSETLADTYGVILYQEQVLQIANRIAGLSLAESDLLRRAMSHFDPGKKMQQLKQKFIRGAESISYIDSPTAEQIWDMMAAFAGYGFPKAHAASYAQVAWRSAWCKAHFPAEFIAAVLANWGGYYSQRVYLMEARRLGYKAKPPHINHSAREFTVKYPQGEAVLYMGLNQIRDLTSRTIGRIIQFRPYHSLEDFLSRVDPRPGEAKNLILCGALEGLGSIPSMLKNVETIPRLAGQPTLFSLAQSSSEPDFSIQQRAAAQEMVLGISVDIHPLEVVEGQARAAGAVSTLEAVSRSGQKVSIAGIRQTFHRSKTSKGEPMAFLTLEDLEGSIDVVLFPDVYKRIPRAVLSQASPLLIEGVVELDPNGRDPLIRASKVELLASESET